MLYTVVVNEHIKNQTVTFVIPFNGTNTQTIMWL